MPQSKSLYGPRLSTPYLASTLARPGAGDTKQRVNVVHVHLVVQGALVPNAIKELLLGLSDLVVVARLLAEVKLLEIECR
jgi:hypothetical protein